MIQIVSMVFSVSALIVSVRNVRVVTKAGRVAADANRRISQIQRGDAS